MAISGSVWRAMAVATVIAMVAMTAEGACSLNDVASCTSAVVNNAAPTGGCCSEVMNVDPNCFCGLLTGNSYPQNYVTNAFNIPVKCGGAVHAKFQGVECKGMRVP